MRMERHQPCLRRSSEDDLRSTRCRITPPHRCTGSIRTIRFHDLRHTHASLLAASSTPIKVVSERLGHAHPGFTMATYQHVMPGMGASAAHTFGLMLSTQHDITEGSRQHPSPPTAGRHLPVRIRKRPGSRIVAQTAGR